MKKTVQIESFLELQFLSNPGISPDGNLIAFIVQQGDKESNKYKGDLWILHNDSRAHRRLTAMGDAKSYCWTGHNTLLFPTMREDAHRKKVDSGEPFTVFYEISPHGGEATEAFTLPLQGAQLTRIDGERYLVNALYDNNCPNVEGLEKAEREKVLKEYKQRSYEVFEELPFWFNDRDVISGKRNRLYLYDRTDGSLEPLTDPTFNVESSCVSKDKIAFRGSSYVHVKPQNPGLYWCDLSTREIHCLLQPEELKTGAVEFFDGGLLVAATEGAEYGSERYLDFFHFSFDGRRTLLAEYEAGIGSGTVASDIRLGGGRGYKVLDDGFYFLTTVDDSTHLRRIDINGIITEVVGQSGSCDSFDVHENGTVVLCGLYGNRGTELYHPDGIQLTHFNDDYVDGHTVATPERHDYVGSDGYGITGWALPPTGYEPGKRYPAILHIHGGPRTVFGTVYHHEMQVWANAGYFVFYCNPRGSDGKGNAFGYISGQYGTVEYQNLMEFADQMLQKYPDVDPGRFGVTGGSYGGFMTNWIIGHTDRFRCAVSQRSIANWVAFEHTSDIGYTFTKTQQLATTRTDLDAMWEQSPMKYAENATTPTLFIHSEKDYRCWMVEGLSMFSALKMNGVESKLCLFKDESHELSRSGKPQNRICRMREILEWMDHYLKA